MGARCHTTSRLSRPGHTTRLTSFFVRTALTLSLLFTVTLGSQYNRYGFNKNMLKKMNPLNMLDTEKMSAFGKKVSNVMMRDSPEYRCQCCTTQRQLIVAVGIAVCDGCKRNVCGSPKTLKGLGAAEEGFCDGLKRRVVRINGLCAPTIKLCQTCRGAQKEQTCFNCPTATVFASPEQKAEHERDEHGGRRLTNQTLIDRPVRESIRCQDS